MKRLELKKNLADKLVEYYGTTGCDRYGQIRTISARQIAKTDEEMDVLKDIVSVALVGYQYGTYEGIFPWGGFKDKDVESLCREAFMKNPSRNNMNNW
jgi:hypothetical protein